MHASLWQAWGTLPCLLALRGQGRTWRGYQAAAHPSPARGATCFPAATRLSAYTPYAPLDPFLHLKLQMVLIFYF